MLKTLLVASSLLAMAGLVTSTRAETPSMQPTISVSGHGEVRQRPDMAMVSAGVTSEADQASAALAANTAAMNKVLAALKAAGIADKDVQTSNFSVQPRYDYNDKSRPKLPKYQIQNTVNVSLRDLGKLGALLDTLVASGANQIGGISFDIADPAAATDEARKRAVADAKHRAELYATASGVTLGPVVSLSEGGAMPMPPVPVRVTMARAAPDSDVPVAEGENAVSADVNVTFALK